MSMSRQDFTAIAEVIKTQHEEALSVLGAASENTTSLQEIAEPLATYYAKTQVLTATVYELVKYFQTANPLFAQWRFYEACGMEKFYAYPVSEQAAKAYRNELTAEEESGVYAYLPAGRWAYKAGASDPS